MLTNGQIQEVRKWLEGLNPPRILFNSWEAGFIISVDDRFAHQGTISERQYETLKKLYEEKGA